MLMSQVVLMIAVSVFAIVFSSQARAEVANEAWEVHYNGPGDDNDRVASMATDTSGNIYVTGYSTGDGTSGDYATIKYDADGNELWVARYDGPASNFDGANSLAVDASGNVYVTGSSEVDGGTLYDYATIKYDTDGNELWVARYDGPSSNYDYAHSLAVDSSGNVYVTGYSHVEGFNIDYATIKYDTDGNELWVARYDGPSSLGDKAYDLALDASGNVYVTGESEWGSIWEDYITIKYDTDGNELWVARYDGPGSSGDYARKLAVDISGDVYVTGYGSGDGTELDYVTIKYDTNGNELWVARYDGPVSESDIANSLAVDASGNVYVAGQSDGDSGRGDYATIKYDADGNELWVARYNGPRDSNDGISHLALDGSGNVYVTGFVTTRTRWQLICFSYGCEWIEVRLSDCGTIKYDTDGNELWVALNKSAGKTVQSGVYLALDASGNVVVTGDYVDNYSFYGDSYTDYATIKYIQLENPPGWGASESVEASTPGYHSRGSSMFNYSFILMVLLSIVIIRKVCKKR